MRAQTRPLTARAIDLQLTSTLKQTSRTRKSNAHSPSSAMNMKGCGPAAVLAAALAALLASSTDAAIAEHVVDSLPGWDFPLPSRQVRHCLSLASPTASLL